MKVNVIDMASKVSGTITIKDEIFCLEPRKDILHRTVLYQLAKKRSGTHKVKNRSEITATTKKMYKQKGTGGARHGSKKVPQFRGGGRAFGPTPRDYNQKINKKVKRLARKSALSIKAKEKSILIVEDFQMDAPKTSAYSKVLEALGLTDKKSLVVLGEPNNNVYLSSRNLGDSKVVINSELSTYQITNASSLVLFESAIAEIETILNKA